MQRVLVTVKRKDETRVRDLEVPAEVEVSYLAHLIAAALHWETDVVGQPVTFEVEAQPLGRRLSPHESLAGAGVWDGSWLILDPLTNVSAPPTIEPPPLNGPVKGWSGPLFTPGSVPHDSPSNPDNSGTSSGFSWKQMDD